MDQHSTQVNRKRKTINDFFLPASPSNTITAPGPKNEQRLDTHARVPGLRLIHNFVTPKEEGEVLIYLNQQQWRTDLSRRVIHYGGTYCLMPPRTATPQERKVIESTILTADPLPAALDFLIERMVSNNLYCQKNTPTYCIVNEYRDNQGISAHVENFKFISPVCGLTLDHGDWIRFHELTTPDDGSVRSGEAKKAKKTGRRVDIWMPPRSLLVMSGEAREKWQHEIVRRKKDRTGDNWRRVSLTFRAEKSSTTT